DRVHVHADALDRAGFARVRGVHGIRRRLPAGGARRAPVDRRRASRSMTLPRLRAHAVARALRPAASLADAVAAMRFVQLDPIRAPARAADLILRQRVPGYRAGDLDRQY